VIIDAHHHLWRLSRGDYGWLTPDLATLYRDFEPADLAPLMAAGGVGGGIVVQAAATEAETRFLLALADQSPAILGVIGWTDFTAPDAAAAIARLAVHPRLKGFRPMLQDDPDDDFILRPAALSALAALHDQGLRLEALVRPRHLPRLIQLRAQFPDLPMVINHAAKPNIAAGQWEPWASDLRRVANDGRTLCKLSGLVTEAAPDADAEQLQPYADLIIDAFGADRVMWGSDWPVVLGAAGYDPWRAMAQALTAERSTAERAAIFGGTAARVYGLDEGGR
jgi:L-fuconolactonase